MLRRVSDSLSLLTVFFVLSIIGFLSGLTTYGGFQSGMGLIGSILGLVGIRKLKSVLSEMLGEDQEEEVESPRFTRERVSEPVAEQREPAREEPKPKREKPKRSEPLIQIDWEQWVGQKLLQKVGILIVLIGMIVFLKYSFDNKWIDELGRVALSVIGGIALLVCGEVFHKRYQQWSQAFTGGGLALMYLTIWVAHVFYASAIAAKYGIVIPASLALVLYSAVTFVGAIASVRYKSEIIAWFTVLGGYLTPFLIDAPTTDPTSLIIYLAILAGGILLLAWHQKWKHLNLAAFALTNFYLFTAVYTVVPEFGDMQQVITASGFFLLFNIVPLLNQFRLKLAAENEDLTLIVANGVAVFLPVVDAVGGWQSGYVGFVCLVLAAFYLLFSAAALQKRGQDDRLVNTYLVGTVLLVAGALLAELEREWVAAGWAPLSALLVFMSSRLQRKGPWFCSVALLVGSLFFLMANLPLHTPKTEELWHPFTSNWALQSYAVFVSVLGWIQFTKKLPKTLVQEDGMESLKFLLHAIVAALVFAAVTFEATRLDFTVDLIWTAAYIGLGVVAIALFFLTENIVWFITALAVQIISILFIFVYGESSGMIFFSDDPLRPFLHPWGYLSVLALLATVSMMYVSKVKPVKLIEKVPMNALFIGIALAQVWVHVSVEIANMSEAMGWSYLFYDRVLSGWWIVFALGALVLGVFKDKQVWRFAGVALLALPFIRNHFFIVGGDDRMAETILWTALSLGVAITGAKHRYKEMLTGGILLLAGAAAIDMLSHLGDNTAGLLRSSWWALAGLATMVGGFIEREKNLRQVAMLIFGATALKLLLVDFNGLATPVRIGASIATGLLMIGASYLYQRFDTSPKSSK